MAFYTFTKQGQIIAKPASMGTNDGPYYPSVVDMTGDANFPADYAMYVSTDHASVGTDAGIWLFVCTGDPSVAANWQDYDDALAAGDFDAFGTKPASNPIYIDTTQGTQTETPCVVKVGSSYFLTYHNQGIDGTQRTLLATGSDGLNFTRINGASDSVILTYDPAVQPGSGHTGYFRWGENPFAGVPHTYVGYSLFGGGGVGHAMQWGSDDGQTWTQLGLLERERPRLGLPEDFEVKWLEIDPNSIRQIDSGEYVALVAVGDAASGAAERTLEVYEIVVDPTGRRITRNARLVLDNGAASSIDENEVAQPWTIFYQGNPVTFYQAANADSANVIACATGTFDSSAALPAPRHPAIPSLRRYYVDFREVSALPGWLEDISDAGVSLSFDASGLTLTIPNNGDFAALRFSRAVNPEQFTHIAVRAIQSRGASVNRERVPLVGIDDKASGGDPSNGVYINTFNGAGGLLQRRVAVGGVNVVDSAFASYDWGYSDDEVTSHRDIGLRWWPAESLATVTAGSNQEVASIDVDDSLDLTADLRPRISVRNSGVASLDFVIEGIEIEFTGGEPPRGITGASPFGGTLIRRTRTIER